MSNLDREIVQEINQSGIYSMYGWLFILSHVYLLGATAVKTSYPKSLVFLTV